MQNQENPRPSDGALPEVRLRIMGISLNQVKPGSYARVLIMGQINGPYRLPIVVGQAEAESIAIAVEGIHPPRPLTHDLFTAFAHAWGIQLRRVFIYRFEDGIYYSELTFLDTDGKEVRLDARTSDAIALAARTNVPIFTTQAIIDEIGFVINDDKVARRPDKDAAEPQDSREQDSPEATAKPAQSQLSLPQLEKRLELLIQDENYEEASRIRDIINARKAKDQ